MKEHAIHTDKDLLELERELEDCESALKYISGRYKELQNYWKGGSNPFFLLRDSLFP